MPTIVVARLPRMAWRRRTLNGNIAKLVQKMSGEQLEIQVGSDRIAIPPGKSMGQQKKYCQHL